MRSKSAISWSPLALTLLACSGSNAGSAGSAEGSYSNYSGAASIRGRGNSTWLWYAKKPYRIKLNENAEILGLKADNFNWTNMETSHDYFAQQELILGADPARNRSIPTIFVNMFKNEQFVAEFKARWTAIGATLLSHCWGIMENNSSAIASALDRNATRWPIGKDYLAETARMKQWLQARITNLDAVINAYPTN